MEAPAARHGIRVLARQRRTHPPETLANVMRHTTDRRIVGQLRHRDRIVDTHPAWSDPREMGTHGRYLTCAKTSVRCRSLAAARFPCCPQGHRRCHRNGRWDRPRGRYGGVRAPCALASPYVADRPRYPMTVRQMRTALVPPNAKEFDMAAVRLPAVRAFPGT